MSKRLACSILLALLAMATLFHLLVLTQVVHFRHVWGGRLETTGEMYAFEIFSLLINTFLIYVVLQKAGYIKRELSPRVINYILYIFAGIFALNTVANLFAEHWLEKTLGTLLTFASAFLCWRIARKP